jgi:hypothetical protein
MHENSAIVLRQSQNRSFRRTDLILEVYYGDHSSHAALLRLFRLFSVRLSPEFRKNYGHAK